MYTYIFIISLVLLVIYFFMRFKKGKKQKAKTVYNNIKGYENTSEIKEAVTELIKEPKKNSEDCLILGDMLRYNLQLEAEAIEAYNLGLALAHDSIAYNINDRLHPEQPLAVNVNTNNTNVIIENVKPKNIHIRSDPQNVHDSNVVFQIRERYNKIRNNYPDSDNCLKRFLKKHPETKKIVDNIRYNPCELEAINATDYDVLLTVINRGEHVWDILADNLKSAEDVCLTGRISQILDALTIIDDPQPIISVDILRKEIFDDAGQFSIKNEHLEDGLEEALLNYIDTKYKHLCEPKVFEKIKTEVQMGF